jgi:hypothetical protein
MIMTGDMGRTWKESVAAYFRIVGDREKKLQKNFS